MVPIGQEQFIEHKESIVVGRSQKNNKASTILQRIPSPNGPDSRTLGIVFILVVIFSVLVLWKARFRVTMSGFSCIFRN